MLREVIIDENATPPPHPHTHLLRFEDLLEPRAVLREIIMNVNAPPSPSPPHSTHTPAEMLKIRTANIYLVPHFKNILNNLFIDTKDSLVLSYLVIPLILMIIYL